MALAAAARGSRRVALAATLACLALATALFLYEVDSPEDGLRMPWLRARADAPRAGRA